MARQNLTGCAKLMTSQGSTSLLAFCLKGEILQIHHLQDAVCTTGCWHSIVQILQDQGCTGNKLPTAWSSQQSVHGVGPTSPSQRSPPVKFKIPEQFVTGSGWMIHSCCRQKKFVITKNNKVGHVNPAWVNFNKKTLTR